ncbi:ACP dehydratase [Desulforhopalus vacuolatus]|uniref:ApeP family dehydratase n=1 Tax=Desulforhopalus vacuolatus TaxID=40414 RepID=UPI0019640481|nr:ACP dehydratase [Desulforhopalus vacuolatus]MBM9519742.1 ACP dehydratase [Desulforhopalus vacuolatus]
MKESENKYFALPISAEQLLPHRAPMLLVDCLTEYSANTAIARAHLPTDGIFYNNGEFLPEFFIELIAQTAALQNGYTTLLAGEKLRSGMLVGLENFSLLHSARASNHLRIKVERTFTFGAITFVKGQIFSEGKLLAEGNLKVWEELRET